MALIVQKYGGSSVGSVERIQAVARRIMTTVQAGQGKNSVVVVVSAMGKTTDGLIKLATEITPQPNRREMDMLLSTGEQVSIALLSMALQHYGQAAISLNGAQVGIVTESAHTRARILHIETERLERHLGQGKVVVVAGFQGISNSEDLEVTTLGRGGSDTSAVALAAALKADLCEIYTDVPGILTTDPRIVENARLLDEITCDEMLELASLGAKVLHPRAVEIARNYGVKLAVRSSWTEDAGTLVLSPPRPPRPLEGLEIARPVDGISIDTDQAKIALLHVPDRPGIAAHFFGELARTGLDVDLIIQSIQEDESGEPPGHNDIAFTVRTGLLAEAEAVARRVGQELGCSEVTVDTHVAKVSIAGAGMIGRPGVAAQMFTTLAAAGINLQLISTSEVKVSCIVSVDDGQKAITSLCLGFDVDNSAARLDASTPIALVSPAPVRGVALDVNQARLAIRQVPDRPGMAAHLFQTLAKQGVSVDMIIQSQRGKVVNGVMTNDIAFTVSQVDAEAARTALEEVARELGCGSVVLDKGIAKVSIVGTGMVGQPGVAARMFAALAQEQINIEMIATSEIKVSCVVAEDEGPRALRAIHTAFELAGSVPVSVAKP
ncbi:aspartate kinase [Leptolyngbya sp. FACHB-261]|uniref:aspartate kinase n=1 Tax=Leptolyngbya sp. FACHB-261 TaxID=2692806 RepID=UPI00168310FC|nr:aspartate kinase [Leptolyngbya sp. FACHB-261]MBD2103647.1 aspartate kinase [Leptolyngbya sp. FACHB-261]